jgi:competence protein ComEA
MPIHTFSIKGHSYHEYAEAVMLMTANAFIPHKNFEGEQRMNLQERSIRWLGAVLGGLGIVLIGYALWAGKAESGMDSAEWTPLNEAVAEALAAGDPPLAEAEASAVTKGEDGNTEGNPSDKEGAVEAAAAAETGGSESVESAAESTPAAEPVESAAESTPAAASGDPPADAGVRAEPDGRINLNTATADELVQLPGIGESKARAIVEYRERHGRFKNPEELMQVKGIGAKTYENLKDRIRIN